MPRIVGLRMCGFDDARRVRDSTSGTRTRLRRHSEAGTLARETWRCGIQTGTSPFRTEARISSYPAGRYACRVLQRNMGLTLLRSECVEFGDRAGWDLCLRLAVTSHVCTPRIGQSSRHSGSRGRSTGTSAVGRAPHGVCDSAPSTCGEVARETRDVWRGPEEICARATTGLRVSGMGCSCGRFTRQFPLCSFALDVLTWM